MSHRWNISAKTLFWVGTIALLPHISYAATAWILAQRISGQELWKTRSNPRTYCSVIIKESTLQYLTNTSYGDSAAAETEKAKDRLLGLLQVKDRVITKRGFKGSGLGRSLSLQGTYIDNQNDVVNFTELHRNVRGRGELILCSSAKMVGETILRDFLQARERQ